jgi:hypothetical protein
MAALIRTYPSEEAAHLAVEALRAAGVQPGDIRLLTGPPSRDTAREPRGRFAGTVEAGAPAGSFAGRRRGEIGSFATGNVQRPPQRRRRGSFGDVERVVIVSHEGQVARSRVTGYRGIRVLLRMAALDESVVDRTVSVLHKGHSVVLVDGAETALSAAQAHFQQMTEAA